MCSVTGNMPTPTSTFGLVERAKSGDTEAFSLLFRKYRKRLAVLIHYRMSEQLRGKMEVDDILQESFFAAAQEIERFDYRAPGSFFSWLATIAQRTIVDAARFHGRQKRHDGERVHLKTSSDSSGVEPANFETPSRIFLREERLRTLLEKIDALSEEQREVILLAKFEGLSTEEIATRMGKERGAVAVLLHRTLNRLRDSVQKAGHE